MSPATPSPVSFLSDYGLADEFVGVVHGVIARIAPDVRVIDVTHAVPRGNVRAGALALMRAVQYLPGGVALAVVDPGVGTSRRAIAAATPWGVFVGPDNGLLAPAVAMVGGAERIVSIEAPEFRLPGDAATFDGRDVFAPAAAVLASGHAGLGDLGPEVGSESVTPLLLPLAEQEAGGVRAEAWWVDGFGNVQFNVAPEDLAGLGATIEVVVGATAHDVVRAGTFGDVEPGDPALIVDSYGMMALVVREGRADERFGLVDGTAVVLRATR